MAYHGCPAHVVSSILSEGQLLRPGDTLIDGSTLPNRLTRGGEQRVGIYTSPSFRYSELDIYTKPQQWEGHTMRVMLQCRQKPGSFSSEGETIGWTREWGAAAISHNFSNSEIERFTQARNSIIPYRLLVGVDVTTREEEEKGKRAERGRLQKAVDDARQVLADCKRAREEAEAKKLEAARAQAEAEAKAMQAELDLKVACDALDAARN